MTKTCCDRPAVKTLTTDTGMVYACQSCSRHWFRTYENAAGMFAEQERCPPSEPDAAPQSLGLLMPDGTVRAVPAYLDKPQNLWTEEERRTHAGFQDDVLRMQRAAEKAE